MRYPEIIKKLNLVRLPEEGGYYRETYRTETCTAIYYLITEDNFSGLHTVNMDEIFHFYAGSAVEMFQIHPDGRGESIRIGNDLQNGEVPQVIVPKDVWQGTKLASPKPGAWALLGCTVSPAFQFEKFHIKNRAELTQMFPQHADKISKFASVLI